MPENSVRQPGATRKGRSTTAASARSGSQTVDRSLVLLKLVAEAPPEGVRLMSLAEQSGLDRSTTYRLLSTLVQHNFVDQDTQSKRYTLGLEFFALASAASNRFDLSEKAREVLTTLVEGTGDTAAYCLRSGNKLICIEVVTGSYPLATLAMDIGSHRPIWAGATGIALLAALPDDEIEGILADEETAEPRAPGFDRAGIESRVARCRERGCALDTDDKQGKVVGLALALLARNGRPIGTLTLNGTADRFAHDRVTALAALLREQAARLDRSLRQLPESERKRNAWVGLYRGRSASHASDATRERLDE